MAQNTVLQPSRIANAEGCLSAREGQPILPPSQQPEGEVKSKKIGSRTTVSGSTSVVRTREPEVNRTVRLKVISIKHLSDKCSIVG